MTKLREDLMETARLAAEAAKKLGVGPEERAVNARSARDALEAAKLADVDPAPVLAGLETLAELLEAEGFDSVVVDDPAAGLADIIEYVKDMRDKLLLAAGVAQAYEVMADFAEKLMVDYEKNAAVNDVAARYFRRVDDARSTAEQHIAEAKRQIKREEL